VLEECSLMGDVLLPRLVRRLGDNHGASLSGEASRGDHDFPPQERKVHTAVEYSNEYGLTGTSVYVYGRYDLPDLGNRAYVL
jgi:hypothetical protein